MTLEFTFSRCLLLVQEYRKPGKDMSNELMKKVTRHANRLIALDPENPASFEIMSYVLMKETKTLPDAAK